MSPKLARQPYQRVRMKRRLCPGCKRLMAVRKDGGFTQHQPCVPLFTSRYSLRRVNNAH